MTTIHPRATSAGTGPAAPIGDASAKSAPEEQLAAALAAFGMSSSRAHSAASIFAGGARVTPSGVILATTSAAVRLPAAKRRPT